MSMTRSTSLALVLTSALAVPTLTACSSRSAAPGAAPVGATSATAPGTAPTPTDAGTPSATTTPSGTNASPTALPAADPADIPADRKDFGFIQKIYDKDGTTYISFDRATFLTGDAANKAAAEHGYPTPIDNDYLIVNDNPKLRELPLAAAVKVLGSGALGGGQPSPTPVTLQALIAMTASSMGGNVPFHVYFDGNGQVNTIEEQFVP